MISRKNQGRGRPDNSRRSAGKFRELLCSALLPRHHGFGYFFARKSGPCSSCDPIWATGFMVHPGCHGRLFAWAQQPVVAATVVSVEGSVEMFRAASTNWTPAFRSNQPRAIQSRHGRPPPASAASSLCCERTGWRAKSAARIVNDGNYYGTTEYGGTNNQGTGKSPVKMGLKSLSVAVCRAVANQDDLLQRQGS